MRIRIQIRIRGGGGRSAKNVHPPWQNPRYAPACPCPLCCPPNPVLTGELLKTAIGYTLFSCRTTRLVHFIYLVNYRYQVYTLIQKILQMHCTSANLFGIKIHVLCLMSSAVLRIHDIFGWIRIRESMLLTNGCGSGCGSGSFYFHH
jgi:hypothetical protein